MTSSLDEKKTSDELIRDIKKDFESGLGYELSFKLGGALEAAIEEKVYGANSHAELGRHVEAIMKHFKGLEWA